MAIYLEYQQCKTFVTYINLLKSSITVNIDQFYNDFFNIDTCNSKGLDNWGLILDRSRNVNVPGLRYYRNIGFDQGVGVDPETLTPQNFNNGNFFDNRDQITVALDDMAYRDLLKLVYLNYVTNATLFTINTNLNYYFNPTGENNKHVRVTNTAPRQITYAFDFTPEPFQQLLFEQDNLLPTPIGVEAIIIYPS